MIEHRNKFIDGFLEKFDAESEMPLNEKRAGLSSVWWFMLHEFEPQKTNELLKAYGSVSEIRNALSKDYASVRRQLLDSCSSVASRDFLMQFIDVNNPEFDKWDLGELNGSAALILELNYGLGINEVEEIYRKYVENQC